MFIARILIASTLVLALAGCAEYALTNSLHPGMTAGQVRTLAGAPSETRVLPGNGKAWYYVYGFAGFTTYRVRFDAQDRVVDVAQVLTQKNFTQHLFPERSTREQVLDDFGPPGLVNRFPNMNEVVWTYRWRDVTLEMLADLNFNAVSGRLEGYSLYRDPAYVSGQEY